MRLSSAFVGSLLAVATACSSSSTSPTNPSGGSVVDVTIQDFVFSPATVTIKAGTTVRWTNNGPSAHTTVSDMGVWTSGTLGAPGGGGGYGGGGSGGTFSYTFMTPGTFGYHCAIHPPTLAQYSGFVGTVAVNP